MLNKNKKYLRPSSEDRKKVMVMTLCIIFLLSVLFIQFFKVQVIEHKKWVHKAKQQHQVTVNEPFKRGVKIFINNLTMYCS